MRVRKGLYILYAREKGFVYTSCVCAAQLPRLDEVAGLEQPGRLLAVAGWGRTGCVFLFETDR